MVRNLFVFGIASWLSSFVALFTFPQVSALWIISGSIGAVLMVPHLYWSCPACRKPFFSNWWAFTSDFEEMFNPFRRKCAHCENAELAFHFLHRPIVGDTE